MHGKAVRRRFAAVLAMATVAGLAAIVPQAPVAAAGGTPTCVVSPKAPANDCFDTPQTLTGDAGDVAGDTSGASLDVGEPGPKEGSSVWFQWTALNKGDTVFATRHSALDTVVNIYTGDTLTDLVWVAGDDNGGPGLTSRVFFTAAAGTTYRIQVFGTLQSAGPFQLQWGPFVPPVPPANDAFAAATTISGSSGTTTGTTEGATKETGEPDHGSGVSVWLNWTAPDDGVTQFSTAGSEFDTLLGAYTGDKVDALTEVAFDDNANGDTASLIVVRATKGVTYHLLVDGSGGDYGEYQLAWQPVAVAANDDQANAEVLTGDEGTVTGSTVGSSKEPGEPDHAGDPGGASVWFSWTSSKGGAVEFTTAGSSFDTLLAVYLDDPKAGLTLVASNDDEGTAPTSAVVFDAAAQTTYLIAVDGKGGASGAYSLQWGAPLSPGNDNFAKAQFISGISGDIGGTNVRATREPGEPDHAGVPGGASVWYTWAAPASGTYVFTTEGASFDTVLAAVPGSSVTETTELDGNDDADPSTTLSRITFDAAGGTGANIVVDGKAGATGTFTLHWELAFAANDAFAAAAPLGGPSGALTTDNVGATKEKGEPDHAGVAGGASIWYSWTAPADMTVTFHASVPANSYGVVVGVYTGNAVDALTLVAAGGPSFGAARATFRATKGTQYRVALDTVAGRMGALRLRWDPPPANDDVASATPIGGASGSVVASNAGATAQPGEPTNGNSGGASVWFAWTAPSPGAATFRVTGATFNSEAAVYTGADVAHLTEVVEGSGAMTFTAAASQTYLVAVDGSGGVVGAFTLEWSLVAPPSNDGFAARQDIGGAGGSVDGTTRGATVDPAEPAPAGVTGASVWYRWTAPSTGRVTFTGPVPFAVYTGDAVGTLALVVSDQNTGVNRTLGDDARFAATAGLTYDIGVATTTDRETTFTLRWAPTPANDDLSDPLPISGESGKLTTTSEGATEQYGVEPQHTNSFGGVAGNSVWFAFTPPVRGVYETVAGSSFDNRSVEWYADDGKGTLVKLPQNDLQGGAVATLEAGTRYLLAVDDPIGKAFDLVWDRTPAPANDDFENAAPISGPSGEVFVNTYGATVQPGEPDHAGVPGNASVWYRWTAPADGRFTFVGGELLGVYTGSSLTQLTPVAADDDPPYVGKNTPAGVDVDGKCMTRDLTIAEAAFDARGGQEYRIAVDGARLAVDLQWAPTPANDDLARAALIQGATGTMAGTTTLATREVGEFTPSCPPGVATVHYTWTAPSSGVYRFRVDMPSIFPDLPSVAIATGGGTFDKLGPAPLTNEPNRTASNNVFLAATGGTAYSIQVSAAGYENGGFTLTWSPVPANDDFANAVAIGGASGSVSGSNVGATAEPGEPRLLNGQDAHASVWYRWTAPHDGTFRLDVSGSGIDGSVMAFSGDRVDGLKETLNADPFAPDHTTAVTASAGQVLAIRVDGLGATTGPVRLDWSEPMPQVQVGDAFPVSETDAASGKGSAGFPVFLSFPTARDVSVAYRTMDATASAGAGDYTAASGRLAVKPFDTSGLIDVTVNDDALNEATETFSVVLSDPVNATVLRGTGTGTILDDDPLPVLSVGSVSVTEGDSGTAPAVVPLTLGHASGRAIRVSVTTADGTAHAGSDYQSVSTDVTVPAGTTAASVSIPIVGDTVIEPTESFSLGVKADFATVAPGGGVITIADEDAAPVVTSTTATPSAAVGTPVQVRVDFTDQDLPDHHTAVVQWGDGSTAPLSVQETPGAGSATASHAYPTAGLFAPRVTVTDSGGGVTTAVLPLVAVFDPAGGAVSASGRIGTDKGPAFTVDAAYTKKAAAPNGSVTLQTDTIDFSGTSIDWLVVAGNKAVVAGTGKVGKQDGYRFVVAVIGGTQPQVRFQITDPTGKVVFDTQPGAPIDAAPTTPLAKAKLTIG